MSLSDCICLIAESMAGLILLIVLSKIDFDSMNVAIGVVHRCPSNGVPSKVPL
jgi:hypothetical protein